MDGVSTFNPDVPDFAVQQIELQEGKHHLASVSSASITIVTSGKANVGNLNLEPGTVFYSDANETMDLTIDQQFVAYRAFVA